MSTIRSLVLALLLFHTMGVVPAIATVQLINGESLNQPHGKILYQSHQNNQLNVQPTGGPPPNTPVSVPPQQPPEPAAVLTEQTTPAMVIRHPVRVGVVPQLADMATSPELSAHARTPITMEKLTRRDFRAGETVTVTVHNADREVFVTKVLDSLGRVVPGEIQQTDNGTTSQLELASSAMQLRPGKYTLAITDQTGKTSTQDFTWGVLAINTDKSIYQPREMADIAMAVLDDKGAMVCNAKLDLQVTTPQGHVDTLSTGNHQIALHSACSSTQFTLTPDYEAHYTMAGPGVYHLQLTAVTAKGTYAISDTITVQDAPPLFVVSRTSATRLYPPLAYPMTIAVTAAQAFTGTITETVPDSFTITPASSASGEQSYDSLSTLYATSSADPRTGLYKQVLGAKNNALVMPFDTAAPITQGFGAALTDPSLQAFYTHYGLGGHDGVDFGLPMGTPLYAVDDGNVVWAGPGDYGTTVVIQHSWGKSYYGHLSKTTVSVSMHIGKASLIGYSGESGEATGPHLHFGIKPVNPDMGNGYAGKVDPLPYLPGLTAGGQLLLHQGTLAVLGSATDLSAAASSAAQPSFTVTTGTSVNTASVSGNATVETVKVISWHVSVQKGETIKLSYTYNVPLVSPQFYLVGPLQFAADGVHPTVVYQDSRKWQLAADAVGVDWYNQSWQYRKQITLIHTKVPNTDQTAFPVLINLASDSDLAANAQASGNDILFTDATGRTKLSHEIELYTTATGQLVAWVKLPTLSHTVDTTIYMYYGNPSAAAQQDAVNVWDGNYVGVWHMNQATSTTTNDSTSNGNTGTLTNSPTFVTTGQIGNAISYSGANQYIDAGSASSLDNLKAGSGMSIEGWINVIDKGVAAWSQIMIKAQDGAPTNGWLFQYYSVDKNTQFEHQGTTDLQRLQVEGAHNSLGFSQWAHVAMTWTGSNAYSTVHLYINGTEVASYYYEHSGAGLKDDSAQSLTMGCALGGDVTNCMEGSEDEMRLSKSVRGADWIKTEYNNESSPSTFETVGSVETRAFAPTMDKVMRHGKYFDSTGVLQPFTF